MNYRAWNEKTKKMYDVPSYNLFDGRIYRSEKAISEYDKDSVIDYVFDELKGYIVMGFTGRYDVNKKPIFEGDIVEINQPMLENVKEDKGIVKFFNGHWIIGSINDGVYLDNNTYNYVLGNVFENPELLEG